MVIIKKYSNRRLYDTEESRYITQDELAEKIKGGTDARVVDAKSGADLTQQTLTQLVLERGAGRILPAALLTQMLRLDDAALAEFLGYTMTWAMGIFLRTRQGMRGMADVAGQVNPMHAMAAMAQQNPFAQMFGGGAYGQAGGMPMTPWGTTVQPPPQQPAGRRPPWMQHDAAAQEAAAAAAAEEEDAEPEADDTPAEAPSKAEGAEAEAPASGAEDNSEVEALRREMSELKEMMKMLAKSKE